MFLFYSSVWKSDHVALVFTATLGSYGCVHKLINESKNYFLKLNDHHRPIHRTYVHHPVFPSNHDYIIFLLGIRNRYIEAK